MAQPQRRRYFSCQARVLTIAGLKFMSFLSSAEIATALVEAGYAVLTFDKRGIGQSNGHYDEAGYEDRTSDALAALRWLSAQPGSRYAINLDLLGHSEGCYVAAIAATRSPLVKFMVWLAPAAESVPDSDCLRNPQQWPTPRPAQARKIAQRRAAQPAAALPVMAGSHQPPGLAAGRIGPPPLARQQTGPLQPPLVPDL